ncbi:hypothetical protein ATO67_00145 [Agrobacterium bohemicum]|uniref:Uncharacterized protein n=1 Tax=Agrobacterium bohemicum TaxID=2052828 RepID=A0A135P503_9HYPH|nr:hypothetical protein ATO67_00145 [Agrobacterium bohemicum]
MPKIHPPPNRTVSRDSAGKAQVALASTRNVRVAVNAAKRQAYVAVRFPSRFGTAAAGLGDEPYGAKPGPFKARLNLTFHQRVRLPAGGEIYDDTEMPEATQMRSQRTNHTRDITAFACALRIE